MGFFDKAKKEVESYSGDNSSGDYDKKNKDASFTAKAMDAAEKYHAQEKVAEFAQKRVAERESQSSEEQMNKPFVNKAVESAEDFLAKQGGGNGKSKNTNNDASPTSFGNGDDKNQSNSCSSSSTSINLHRGNANIPSSYLTRNDFDNSNRDSNASNAGSNDQDDSYSSFGKMNLSDADVGQGSNSTYRASRSPGKTTGDETDGDSRFSGIDYHMTQGSSYSGNSRHYSNSAYQGVGGRADSYDKPSSGQTARTGDRSAHDQDNSAVNENYSRHTGGSDDAPRSFRRGNNDNSISYGSRTDANTSYSGDSSSNSSLSYASLGGQTDVNGPSINGDNFRTDSVLGRSKDSLRRSSENDGNANYSSYSTGANTGDDNTRGMDGGAYGFRGENRSGRRPGRSSGGNQTYEGDGSAGYE